ncbi:uncharacterized protein LOC122974461 [Thunnus albacares]|uniref:uncharacterized protein LOC122974461 n=1 Tax=Thunnus albacares TaxID=8236 RepID=UPI001CF61E5C|nr:uncharacterized protein LOC122974461 [Thunnus albacares]
MSQLLLLLLLVCSSQASHFYGTVMTYYPKNTHADGSVTKWNVDVPQRELWKCELSNGRHRWGERCMVSERGNLNSAGSQQRSVSAGSCTLSFSPTNSSNEGAYVVQLVMEDFPRETINLIQTNGSQEVKTTSNAISKIPVQFALKVDPVVPSCTEGLYLPKFLPPTPANRAQLYTSVNQTLEIRINAQANNSTISELLFSGPHNINETTLGTGQFSLRWTPSESENGESHPVCFVVQAELKSVP